MTGRDEHYILASSASDTKGQVHDRVERERL
jgi:hypothetical protein